MNLKSGLGSTEAFVVSVALVIFTVLCFQIESLSVLYASILARAKSQSVSETKAERKENLRQSLDVAQRRLQEARENASFNNNDDDNGPSPREQARMLKVEIDLALENASNPRRIADVFALSTKMYHDLHYQGFVPDTRDRKLVGQLYTIVLNRAKYLVEAHCSNEDSVCEILGLWEKFQSICFLCGVDHQLYKDVSHEAIPKIVEELTNRTSNDINMQAEAFVLKW